jgi:hypothetical protein
MPAVNYRFWAVFLFWTRKKHTIQLHIFYHYKLIQQTMYYISVTDSLFSYIQNASCKEESEELSTKFYTRHRAIPA